MRIGKDVAWTGADQRVVALNLARLEQQPLVIEGSGVAVWTTIFEREPATTSDLVRDLAEQFAAPDEQIAADIEGVVVALRENGLVTD